jgi:hypothetical protein
MAEDPFIGLPRQLMKNLRTGPAADVYRSPDTLNPRQQNQLSFQLSSTPPGSDQGHTRKTPVTKFRPPARELLRVGAAVA